MPLYNGCLEGSVMPSMIVKDYMQSNMPIIFGDASVSDVVEYLLERGLTGAPVVDQHHRLIGFVSEQDCIKEMLNSAFYSEDSGSVTSIMCRDLLSVSPDTSIMELAETMLGDKPKCYPVVDHGKLVGQINRRQILQALYDHNDCYFPLKQGSTRFVSKPVSHK